MEATDYTDEDMVPAPLRVSRSSRTTQSQIIKRVRRYNHTHGTGRFDGVNELPSEVRGSVLHLIPSANWIPPLSYYTWNNKHTLRDEKCRNLCLKAHRIHRSICISMPLHK